LLALLPGGVVPAVDGLPTYSGCENCSVAPGSRGALEKCGKALTQATQRLVGTLESVSGTCASTAFACVQTKASDPVCLAGAVAACDKGTTKVAAAFANFAAAVAKQCGSAAIDFDQLTDPAGLNLAATTVSCAATPTSAETLADCLRRGASARRGVGASDLRSAARARRERPPRRSARASQPGVQ
jgi:hypothetical protein